MGDAVYNGTGELILPAQTRPKNVSQLTEDVGALQDTVGLLAQSIDDQQVQYTTLSLQVIDLAAQINP